MNRRIPPGPGIRGEASTASTPRRRGGHGGRSVGIAARAPAPCFGALLAATLILAILSACTGTAMRAPLLATPTSLAPPVDARRGVGEAGERQSSPIAGLGPQAPTWVGQRRGHTSTFSVDVDSASYAIARRSVERHARMPEPRRIRVEEFVNAVPADDPLPEREAVAMHLELAPHPDGDGRALLRIAIAGRDLAGDRPPLNLVFLIDTSGSMRARDRLALVRRALIRLAQRLGPHDRIAVVAYDRRATVILPPMPGDDATPIVDAIQRLRAGGSTNGAAGLRRAYALARAGLAQGGVHRVMLATDGNFNAGATDRQRLEALVRREADHGIALSVLGVGDETDDARLEAVSNIGDGNYHHLLDDGEADRVLGRLLDGTLVTVANDVKTQLFFHPGAVRRWRLVGYDNRRLVDRAFDDDRRDGGDIGAGERVVAYYELEWTDAVPEVTTRNPFLDEAGSKPARWAPGDPLLRVRLRYQPVGGGASELIERDLFTVEEIASPAFRWSFSVAAIAMRLRHDPWAPDVDFDGLRRHLRAAHRALGADPRREDFLRFVDRLVVLAGARARGPWSTRR